MAYTFPSEEWTVAFREALNANEAYRKAAHDWTHGAVAMVIAADPSIGLDDDAGMILDVHQGQCRSTKFVKGMAAVEGTPFIIVAPYDRWREVIAGTLDPIKGMMEGKLKLKVGHLPTLIRTVESARQLVTTAARVPTEFLV